MNLGVKCTQIQEWDPDVKALLGAQDLSCTVDGDSIFCDLIFNSPACCGMYGD